MNSTYTNNSCRQELKELYNQIINTGIIPFELYYDVERNPEKHLKKKYQAMVLLNCELKTLKADDFVIVRISSSEKGHLCVITATPEAIIRIQGMENNPIVNIWHGNRVNIL